MESRSDFLQPLLYESCEELAKSFKSLKSPRGLASLLKIPYEYLVYYVYRFPQDRKYRAFKILKSSGGHRAILVPNKSLKIVQRKLSQVLYSIYNPRPCVHGYVPGKSIITNAKSHTRRKFILNIDIKSFFKSINYGRVRGLFIAKPYCLNPPVATFIAQICCHENHLPIGAPTSPVVSNLICSKMDSELQRFAKEHGCFYTRYVDDMTFSINKKNLPSALIANHGPGFSEVVLGNQLREIIEEDNGFQINSSKIRLRHYTQKQEVTGLTVNKFVNVDRKYIRNLLATIHAWEKHGFQNTIDMYMKKYAKESVLPGKETPNFLSYLRGKIEFVGSVRGKNDLTYKKLLNKFFELKTRDSKMIRGI
ncbi:MAG: RNA-directed DNA polymerase [Leptolyngbya sp. SIO1E4]|nr:RNA-directed DNA polymerase [Leptolyngbya sp. SIO1E4]